MPRHHHGPLFGTKLDHENSFPQEQIDRLMAKSNTKEGDDYSESESESDSGPRQRHDSDLDEPEDIQESGNNIQESIEEQRVHRNRAFFETISKALGIQRESEHLTTEQPNIAIAQQSLDGNKKLDQDNLLQKEFALDTLESKKAMRNSSEEKSEQKDDLLFKRKAEDAKIEKKELELLIRDNVRRVT